MRVSDKRHVLAALYPLGNYTRYHRTGGWTGPRAGLNAEAREQIILPLPEIEPQSPGRPVR
jgi:hypothetical protein